jgi:hypothetical protein
MERTKAFLSALFGDVDHGMLSVFTLPSRRAAFFDLSQSGWESLVASRAAVMRDQNVYFGVGILDGEPVGRSRGTEGDICGIPGLWLDVDVDGSGHKSGRLPPTFEDALALIHDFPFAPSIIVYTGGGLHGYWLFNELWRFGSEGERQAAAQLSERFQRHFQAVAAHRGWHCDPTYDLPRILRLPGTVNQKYGRLVEIVEMDGSARYEPDEIVEWLEDFALSFDGGTVDIWAAATSIDATADGASSPDARERARENASQVSRHENGLAAAGGRNNALKKIVAACLERGESLERTIFEALRYDAQNHRPPLFSDITEFRSSHEYSNALGFVSRIVDSINRGRERQGLAPERFTFIELEHNPHFTTGEGGALGGLVFHSLSDIYQDDEPLPPDLIGGGILGPGEFLLVAGPPKSQKSMLVQDMLINAALGREYLGRFPMARPLNVAFINVEMSYRVLRTRIQALALDPDDVDELGRRFKISDRFHMLLDDSGATRLAGALVEIFDGSPPDVICIDPLANVFDGESENDNRAMMDFLRRLESIRAKVNPMAGLILVHHTAKIARRDMTEDPFNAIRGAGALRGHYSSAILIMRESEMTNARRVFFDIRIAESPAPIAIEYDGARFVEITEEQRIAGARQGARHDLEARRKGGAIVKEVARLAAEEGRLMTTRQFSEVYANTRGLGSARNIERKLSELASKGWIKFADGRDLPASFDIPHPNSAGFMVVEGMQCLHQDFDAGVVYGHFPVYPTHEKSSTSGALVAVVDPGAPWHPEDDLDIEPTTSASAPARVETGSPSARTAKHWQEVDDD